MNWMRLPKWVKGGCGRSGGGTAGVPPASEITPPFWDDSIGPPGQVRNSPEAEMVGQGAAKEAGYGFAYNPPYALH